MRRSYGCLVLLMFLVSGGWLQAQKLTPEMVVDLKWVTGVAMQPQGKYVAYSLRVPRSPDEKPGGAYSEIWVVPVSGGKARPYTRKPLSSFAPAWTPDGNWITFLSRRKSYDKYTQVYAIPLDGGEAMQLSHAKGNISRYAISPDGKWLAYTMREEEPEEVKSRKKKGFDEIVEDTWTTLTRLYVEDLESGEHHLVTHDRVNVWDFAWAPDSRRLLYRASERPFTDDRYMMTDWYLVDVNGGVGKKIWDTDGKLGAARMSPDGKWVAWLGAVDFTDPYAGSLFIKPVSGGEPLNLMPDFPGTAVAFAWKDADTVLLVTIEKTKTHLYRVSIPDGQFSRLSDESYPIFRPLSLSADGSVFATVGNRFDHPNEVYVGRTEGGALNRLTDHNPLLKQVRFGKQETISWKGPDGWVIYGIVVKPVDFQEGRRYPLQVQVHGGPESAYLDGWHTSYSTLMQMLAQRGIMVLMPNYRGSIGRGVTFSKGDHQDLMGKEFLDILAGIDTLIARGWVDSSRVGIGGGSYGGYTSAWAATRYSHRFQAAVVFAGIANQISKAGVTDTPVENATVHWNVWLYDNMDLVWDRSPIKHIRNARTPTLIAHGQRDLRVPTGQAYELYRGLKHMKVPTRLIIYPREPHGLRERAHQLDFCRRALAWYEKYLKQ